MIGKTLGDYEISSSLGKGGFGSVWKAKSGLGQSVALKVLNPQVLDNERVVKKFFHEAMILAKLDHPNICKLMEFFPDGDNYAIVMEFVEGIELKKMLKQSKDGLLPFETAYKIAKQTLSAFQYAWEAGILHRDIKPANIMIDNHGNSKIMDFGIAKMSSTASHDTAASMLSVHYTPPERFDKNKEIDQRSDIYSLGLVFYEMFAGRRPFLVTETSEILFAHLNQIPDPPKKYVASIPDSVNDAILKALEKDPEDRFKDFREFSDALDAGVSISVDDGDETQIIDDSPKGAMLEETIDSREMEKQLAAEAKKAGKKGLPKAALAGIMLLLLAVLGTGGYFGYKQFLGGTAAVETSGEEAASPAVDVPEGTVNSKGFTEIVHPKDGATMVLIPEGEFSMGSDEYSAEKPVQKIFLNAYYIDKYPVTNKQFQKFVEETGYVTDAEKEGAGLVRFGRRWKKVDGASWKVPDGLDPIVGREDHPVSQVSWNDAMAYAKWAGKDLPTEAQWEKAARGETGQMYPWGDEDPNDTMANFDNMIGATTEVGEYEKGQSPFGVMGLAGNVYQWIKDWYGTGERLDFNPTGPDSGEDHVIKGGSFLEGMESLRSSNRDRYPPNYSSFLFGFRCAMPAGSN